VIETVCPTPYTLHPTPYTLHPTRDALRPRCSTLNAPPPTGNQVAKEVLESGYLDAEPEELTRVMECAVRANKHQRHERELTRETSPLLDRSLVFPSTLNPQPSTLNQPPSRSLAGMYFVI